MLDLMDIVSQIDNLWDLVSFVVLSIVGTVILLTIVRETKLFERIERPEDYGKD